MNLQPIYVFMAGVCFCLVCSTTSAECSRLDADAAVLLQSHPIMTMGRQGDTGGVSPRTTTATGKLTTCVVDTCFTPTSPSAKCKITPLDDTCCDIARIGRLRLSGTERWKLSQGTELDWWKQVVAGDRHAFNSLGHVAVAYFYDNYHMIPCSLGDVVELGSGAYTQLRVMLERSRGVKQCIEGFKISSYTAVDPLADTIARGELDLGTFESGKFCVSKQHFWSGGCVPTKHIGGDAVNSPLQTGAFDTVVMINTLSYVPDAGETLTSVHAALRPGGVLIIGNEFVVDAADCEGYAAQSSHPICLTRAFYQWFFKRFFTVLHYREAKGQFTKQEDAVATAHRAVEDCGAAMGIVEDECMFYAVLRKRETPDTDVVM